MDSSSSDCPLCLEELSASENIFTLPCGGCKFNFCSTCVDGFVRSSRDDYQTASDGSRQVKVHIACPQCRAKYPIDISKVLLLRKVYNLGIKAFSAEGEPLDDQDLTATELTQKRDLYSRKTKRYVDLSHGLYMKVMEGRVDLEKMERARSICQRVFQSLPESTGKSIDEDDEEEDEYVDNPSSPKSRRVQVDNSLFQGLHDFLGHEEKAFLTELFTSGDVAKVMQASMILNGVLKMSTESSSQARINTLVMDQASQSRADSKKQTELLEKSKKSFPLPLHMPGYFILPSFTSKNQYLSFDDKNYDGSIAPPVQSKRVFSKIYEGHYTPPDAGNQRRVVTLHGVRGPAGRVGLRRGDVVTHINEVEWNGNSKELMQYIDSLCVHHNGQNISITVNATPETSKFLQVRRNMMDRAKLLF